MQKIFLNLQIACTSSSFALPTNKDFHNWIICAIMPFRKQAEVTIRIVDEVESSYLNYTYRSKTNPTNVLAFPCEIPSYIPVHVLGDLVICRPVVEREACSQQRSLLAHWAHMTIHGTLHLLGYDHKSNHEAEIMELHERRMLSSLGY